jgi:hypothetical protein
MYKVLYSAEKCQMRFFNVAKKPDVAKNLRSLLDHIVIPVTYALCTMHYALHEIDKIQAKCGILSAKWQKRMAD